MKAWRRVAHLRLMKEKLADEQQTMRKRKGGRLLSDVSVTPLPPSRSLREAGIVIKTNK